MLLIIANVMILFEITFFLHDSFLFPMKGYQTDYFICICKEQDNLVSRNVRSVTVALYFRFKDSLVLQHV